MDTDDAERNQLHGEDKAARVAVLFPVRTLLTLIAFAALVAAVIFTAGTLLSIAIAIVLALGLDPPTTALVRRGWSRGRASIVMIASVFVAVTTLVLVTAGPLWSEITAFVQMLPTYWEKLTESEAFNTIVNAAGADDVIANALKDLAAGLPDAATALLGIAGGAVGSILSLVTLTFLALFFLMERPSISAWVFSFTRPEGQERWDPVLDQSIKTVSYTLLGNIAISVVAGTVAGLSAWALGLPFPMVLAVMTGLLDLIPQVGATVAGIILVLIALTVSLPAAVIMALIQLIYQQIENYVIYPIVYREAVELTGLTTIGVVMILGALLGVVGAILAVPIAAVVKVILDELARPRREAMAALRGDSPEHTDVAGSDSDAGTEPAGEPASA